MEEHPRNSSAVGRSKLRAAIDRLEMECMDPEAEEHYIELLGRWKRDEDNVKDKLEEIIKRLGDLESKERII